MSDEPEAETPEGLLVGLPVVAFDEAGNTGQNFLDAAQPVFVLASVHMSSERATAFTSAAMPPGATEAKFSTMRGSNAGRKRVLALASPDGRGSLRECRTSRSGESVALRLLAISGCKPNAPDVPEATLNSTDEQAAAQVIYAASCAICHGDSGDGHGLRHDAMSPARGGYLERYRLFSDIGEMAGTRGPG